MSEKLADVFDVEYHDVTAEQQINLPATVPPVEIQGDQPEDVDFSYTRENQYALIEQGKAAILTALKIAAESESPRAIEVLTNLLDKVSGMNRQLVAMGKDRIDIKNAKAQGGGNSQPQQTLISGTNNIMFVGNPTDVNKMLKDKISGN